jgi:hypothetical protein
MVSANIDRLDDFSAETGASGLAGSIGLSEAAHDVRIHWDEAVAVVQEVIEMLSAGREEEPVPGLDAVLIHASGTITLRHRGRGEQGPVAAGRMLHALLASADVPVALRLFVSQATAPETHASLREFAAGLAYYGKPGRADLIRALYRRCVSAGGNRGPQQPSSSPVPAPVEDVRKKSLIASNRRTPSWLAPAVLTLMALAAAVWIVSSGAFDGTGDAGASNSQARSEEALPENQTTAAATGARSAPRTGGDRNSASPSKGTTSVVPNVPPQSRVTTPDGIERNPPPIPVVSRAEEAAPSTAPPLTSDSRGGRGEVDITIYSGDDDDVRPPMMRSPQLPAPLMLSGSRSDLVNRMEILVAADGSVERVRLVGSAARMPDMMLLSGAKLWKFTPAMKDGDPVRYRTFVTWSGFP